jgi:hypothetical protein
MENAIRRVQKDAEILELLVVILGGTAKDMYVVYICRIEIKVLEDLVYETLEGLSGVSQAKGHIGIFEKAERGGDGCLDVVGVGQESGSTLLQGQFWKRWCSWKGGGSSLTCVGLCTSQGRCER